MTLARYRRAWAHAAERTPHGTPIELTRADFRDLPLTGDVVSPAHA